MLAFEALDEGLEDKIETSLVVSFRIAGLNSSRTERSAETHRQVNISVFLYQRVSTQCIFKLIAPRMLKKYYKQNMNKN